MDHYMCIINNWKIYHIAHVSCHSMWGTCPYTKRIKEHLFLGSFGLPGAQFGPLFGPDSQQNGMWALHPLINLAVFLALCMATLLLTFTLEPCLRCFAKIS